MAGSIGWRVERGLRPGLTETERARIKELERENRELRRADEILNADKPIEAGEGVFRYLRLGSPTAAQAPPSDQ